MIVFTICQVMLIGLQKIDRRMQRQDVRGTSILPAGSSQVSPCSSCKTRLLKLTESEAQSPLMPPPPPLHPRESLLKKTSKREKVERDGGAEASLLGTVENVTGKTFMYSAERLADG